MTPGILVRRNIFDNSIYSILIIYFINNQGQRERGRDG